MQILMPHLRPTESSKFDSYFEIYFHKSTGNVHFKEYIETHFMTISCSTLLYPSLPSSRDRHLKYAGWCFWYLPPPFYIICFCCHWQLMDITHHLLICYYYHWWFNASHSTPHSILPGWLTIWLFWLYQYKKLYCNYVKRYSLRSQVLL